MKALKIAVACLPLLAGSLCAQEIGIINFSQVAESSKLGKQEQKTFDELKDQMSSLMEDAQKQLQELSGKLNDPDYMDGLSPEGETELKGKIQGLNQDLSQYQQQYYQVLQQANMRVIQNLQTGVGKASQAVAQEKKLDMLINKEAMFYYNTDLDVTDAVIAEMDKQFDASAKKTTSK